MEFLSWNTKKYMYNVLMVQSLCLSRLCSSRELSPTVKVRGDMDMILFEMFLKSIDLIHNNRYYAALFICIGNVCTIWSCGIKWISKTLQKGSCPYAPLDEVLRVSQIFLTVPSCSVYFQWYVFLISRNCNLNFAYLEYILEPQGDQTCV